MLMLAAGVVCMAGVLPGDMLATPRVLYAMGRDGLLPARLGVVHPRFNTPAAAIATYCIVCAVLALSGTFKALAILAAAGTLVMYLVTAIAVLVLRRRAVNVGKPPFVIPGGPVVPLIAVGGDRRGALDAGLAGTGGHRRDAGRLVGTVHVEGGKR